FSCEWRWSWSGRGLSRARETCPRVCGGRPRGDSGRGESTQGRPPYPLVPCGAVPPRPPCNPAKKLTRVGGHAGRCLGGGAVRSSGMPPPPTSRTVSLFLLLSCVSSSKSFPPSHDTIGPPLLAAWIATSPNPAEQSLNAGQKIGMSPLYAS